MKKLIENITREEQIEAEYFVYRNYSGCGLLSLEEFKQQILGTYNDLRLDFQNALRLHYWLKKNNFYIDQPYITEPEICEHPYHLVYRKMDFERCGKCNKVLCEG